MNVEWLPAKHHALVLSPFAQWGEEGEAAQAAGRTTYRRLGGEIGYRCYGSSWTGAPGANGFFIGPEYVFGRAALGPIATSVDFHGVSPRLLFAAGYSF
jgi:hypothetical protein